MAAIPVVIFAKMAATQKQKMLITLWGSVNTTFGLYNHYVRLQIITKHLPRCMQLYAIASDCKKVNIY